MVNSKGESVLIYEVVWGEVDDVLMYMIFQFIFSYGGVYIGLLGNLFYIDNVKLIY